jgi:hypothetical protein
MIAAARLCAGQPQDDVGSLAAVWSATVLAFADRRLSLSMPPSPGASKSGARSQLIRALATVLLSLVRSFELLAVTPPRLPDIRPLRFELRESKNVNALVPFSPPRRSRGQGRALLVWVASID